MKRNALIVALCLFALAFVAPQSSAQSHAASTVVAASGSSTVGNPDGVKKGSGDRKILSANETETPRVKLA